MPPTNPQTWNRYAYALNNPLSFVDPFGLLVGFCTVNGVQWDDADSEEESDGQASCEDAGGTWTNYSENTSVTVNGDNPSDPGVTIEDGQQVFPEIIPNAANNTTQNRLNCVKNLANAGSVQNAVGLGNAKGTTGWLAGAFLGNNVSSALDLMQAAWGGSAGGVANGTGQAFGSNVAVAGGRAAASQVPNVVSVNVNMAAVSVSTATTTLTVQATTATARVYPWGSLARGAINTISGAFDGKLYFDIGIAVLADYVCLKDGN